MLDAQHWILIVDDDRIVRELLADRLEQQDYQVEIAVNGRAALDALEERPYDLILLDVMMPKMDGMEALIHLKQDIRFLHIPVVIMSALDDHITVEECLRLGAEDYLIKPVDPFLLKARVEGCLARKRWQDMEKAYLMQIEQERLRAETLLLNVLPDPVAERLKYGERTIVDYFEKAAILFADIVDFTQLTTQLSPVQLVETLNLIFSDFDALVDEFNLEKVKTIGDAYMVVGGIFGERGDPITAVADLSLAMQTTIQKYLAPNQQPFQLRIGMNVGPVIAGVIGSKKFSYDLWGDTVNIAHRMQATGLPDTIQVTAEIYSHLNGYYIFQEREPISIKGKGMMITYWLNGRR